ncbi:MAG: hypothetical protein ABSB49_17125 [Polyangia bacterium]|jgi:hypothetical protein
MTTDPRTQQDYGQREIEAARRVLVDLAQADQGDSAAAVLGAFGGSYSADNVARHRVVDLAVMLPC